MPEFDSTIADWNKDPEYRALNPQKKQRAVGNYFNKYVADDTFFGLPEEQQQSIRSNFVSDNAAPPIMEGGRVRLRDHEETDFKKWYKDRSNKTGLDPNPDDPLHYYDYRAAYAAGVEPEIDPEDGNYHWDSRYKSDDHPNRFVDGWDTKYDRPEDPVSRGILTDTVNAIGRGIAGYPELLMRAAAGADEAVDLYFPEEDTPGNFDLKKWAREKASGIERARDRALPTSEEAKEGLRRDVLSGVESATTSLTPVLASAGLGYVIGGPIGALIAGGIAHFSGVPAFALSQYDRALEDYQNAGFTRDEAQLPAVIEGVSEGGTEFISDLIEWYTIGAGKAITTPVKAALKPLLAQGIKKVIERGMIVGAAKKASVIFGAEMVGELTNSGIQNEARRAYDLSDENFWEAIKRDFTSVATASLIFSAVGGGINLAQTSRIKKALSDPKVKLRDRLIAVHAVKKAIEESSPVLAEKWTLNAVKAVRQGEGINLEEPVTDEIESAKLLANILNKEAAGTDTYDAALNAINLTQEGGEDADSIREDEGQVRKGGAEQEGGAEKGSKDLQRETPEKAGDKEKTQEKIDIGDLALGGNLAIEDAEKIHKNIRELETVEEADALYPGEETSDRYARAYARERDSAKKATDEFNEEMPEVKLKHDGMNILPSGKIAYFFTPHGEVPGKGGTFQTTAYDKDAIKAALKNHQKVVRDFGPVDKTETVPVVGKEPVEYGFLKFTPESVKKYVPTLVKRMETSQKALWDTETFADSPFYDGSFPIPKKGGIVTARQSKRYAEDPKYKAKIDDVIREITNDIVESNRIMLALQGRTSIDSFGVEYSISPAKEKVRARPTVDTARAWSMEARHKYPYASYLGDVSVREGIQNGLDAVLAALEKGEIKRGRIDITSLNGGNGFRIEDNGIGMSDVDIADKFLALHATGKDKQGRFGGFGIAKAVILGPHETARWILKTRDNYFTKEMADKYDQVQTIEKMQGTSIEVNTDQWIVSSESKMYAETTEVPKTIKIKYDGLDLKSPFKGRKGESFSGLIGEGEEASNIDAIYYPKVNGYNQKLVIRLVDKQTGAKLTQGIVDIGFGGFNGTIVADITTEQTPGSNSYPLTDSRMELMNNGKTFINEIIEKFTVEPGSAQRVGIVTEDWTLDERPEWKETLRRLRRASLGEEGIDDDGYWNMISAINDIWVEAKDKEVITDYPFGMESSPVTDLDSMYVKIDKGYKGYRGGSIFNLKHLAAYEAIGRIYAQASGAAFSADFYGLLSKKDEEGSRVESEYNGARGSLGINFLAVDKKALKSPLRYAMYLVGLLNHEFTHYYASGHNQTYSSIREKTQNDTSHLLPYAIRIAEVVLGKQAELIETKKVKEIVARAKARAKESVKPKVVVKEKIVEKEVETTVEVLKKILPAEQLNWIEENLEKEAIYDNIELYLPEPKGRAWQPELFGRGVGRGAAGRTGVTGKAGAGGRTKLPDTSGAAAADKGRVAAGATGKKPARKDVTAENFLFTAPEGVVLKEENIEALVDSLGIFADEHDVRLLHAAYKGGRFKEEIEDLLERDLEEKDMSVLTTFVKATFTQRGELKKKAPAAKPLILKEEDVELDYPQLGLGLLQNVFPHLAVEQIDKNNFYLTSPTGIKIRLSINDKISVTREEVEEAYGRPMVEGESVRGVWKRLGADGLIKVLKGSPISTLKHEEFHAVWDFLFTQKEKDALLAKYKDEEAAARAFAHWEADKKPHTLFEKIVDFIERLREIVFPTAQGTMKMAASGKVWERKAIAKHGVNGAYMENAGVVSKFDATARINDKVDYDDSIMGTLNNRLSKELEIFETLFGDSDKARYRPGKLVKGERPDVRTITPYDLGAELQRVRNEGLSKSDIAKGKAGDYSVYKKGMLGQALDPAVNAEMLARKQGFSEKHIEKAEDAAAKKALTKKRVQFFKYLKIMREGPIFAAPGDNVKDILGDNGKAGRSVDFLLGFCQPTGPCKVCYAAAGMIRQSTVEKAFRNTAHVLANPVKWANKLSEEILAFDSRDLPFVRLLGSGDLTTTEQIAAFNLLAEKIDRPIHIFSRMHENLLKLEGTQEAPFIKMASIDAELFVTYGSKLYQNGKKGAQNAYLLIDEADLPRLKKLFDKKAIGLILPASEAIHEKMVAKYPEMKDYVCPCDAAERSYFGSCRQCAVNRAGCFKSFSDKEIDKAGKVWDSLDEKKPKGTRSILSFFSKKSMSKGKPWMKAAPDPQAAAYASIAVDILRKNKSMVTNYLRQHEDYKEYTALMEKAVNTGLSKEKLKQYRSLKKQYALTKQEEDRQTDLENKKSEYGEQGIFLDDVELAELKALNKKANPSGEDKKTVKSLEARAIKRGLKGKDKARAKVLEGRSFTRKIPIKDLRWEEARKKTTKMEEVQAFLDEMDSQIEQATIGGTFFLPGGDIQKPISYIGWTRQADPTLVNVRAEMEKSMGKKGEAIKDDVAYSMSPDVKKGKVTNLVTKPVREFSEKLHGDISTRVAEKQKRVREYDGWKFEVGDRVTGNIKGRVYTIVAKSFSKDDPIYYYKGNDGSQGTFSVARGAHESLTKMTGPTSPDIRYAQGEKQVGTPAAPLQRWADKKTKGWDVTVKVVQKESELPADLLVPGRTIYAVTRKPTKTIYIVADNVSLKQGKRLAITHELMHIGIKGVLGEQYDDTMAEIGVFFDLPEGANAEEFLAQLSERSKSKQLYDRIIAFIRDFVRKFDPDLSFSEAEYRDMYNMIANQAIARAKGPAAAKTGIGEFAQDVAFSMKEAVASIKNNPAFTKWFGKSKVVDSDGNPLVVYHGTSQAGFSIFDMGLTGMSYFTPSPDYASAYVQPSMSAIVKTGNQPDKTTEGVYPVYLSIQNMFDTTNPKHKKIFDKEFFGKYGNMTPLNEESGLPDWTDAEDLKEFFEENGYKFDGIKLAESHGNITYAVSEPTQIKSIYNVGTFSETSDDIRYSMAPDVAAEETPPEQVDTRTWIQKAIDYIKHLGKSEDPVWTMLKDPWIGNRDWESLKASVEGMDFMERVEASAKGTGFNAEETNEAMHVYLDLQSHPEDLDEYHDSLTDEQKKIVEISQQLTAEQLAIAEGLDEAYQKIWQIANQAGVITSFVENYVSRSWDFGEERAPHEFYRKFGTTTRHAKRRSYGSILEGWAKGGTLKIKGATNNLTLYKIEIMNTIEHKKLIEQGMETEISTGQPLFSFSRKDSSFELVKHPSFTGWGFAGSINVDYMKTMAERLYRETKTFKKESKGLEMEETVSIKALKQSLKRSLQGRGVDATLAADYIKNIQDASNLNDVTGIVDTFIGKYPVDEEIVQGIEKKEKNIIATKFKPTLGLDFFITPDGTIMRKKRIYAPKPVADNLNNILGTSLLTGVPGINTVTKLNAISKAWILQTSLFHHQAFVRSYLFGGAINDVKDVRFIKTYKEGLKRVRELDPEIELLVKNGLTLFRIQDWEENLLREKTALGKFLDKNKVTRVVKDKITGLQQQQARFLFTKFGAGLKAMAGLHEYQRLLTSRPDLQPNERAKLVANLINDDFGGLHLERMGRNPTLQHIFRLFALAPDWCCLSDTRAMTKTGWKYHHELEVGVDEILAFNPDTKKYQWSKLNDMYVRENFSGDMIKVKNHNREIAMTPDHKCYVYNISKKKHEVVLAKDLKSSHRIPRSAGFDLPTERSYDDTHIKLVGWFVTDGYTKKSKWELKDGSVKEYRYGKITQSKPPMVKMLQEFGMKEHTDSSYYNHDKFKANYYKHTFTIPKENFEQMKADGLCDGLNWEFLSRLTKENLELLYETMMLGDGTGQNRFCGGERKVFFMTMIQTMLGEPSTFYQQEENCWRTRKLSKLKKHITCEYGAVVTEHVDGTIWCPSVDTGFWLAEREGLVFITGNTESNIRSMVKAVASGDKATRDLYQRFWGRIVLRAFTLTTVMNLILATWDDDEDDVGKKQTYWEKVETRYKKAWEKGYLRWLEADITPIYKLTPWADEEKMSHFRVPGHFLDPVKFASNFWVSMHHKGSPAYRILHESVTGSDWRGRKFTTWDELIGLGMEEGKRGSLTKFAAGSRGPIEYKQLPSYTLAQLRQVQPIQVQNSFALMSGEMDAFAAMAKSLGIMISVSKDVSLEEAKYDKRKSRINRTIRAVRDLSPKERPEVVKRGWDSMREYALIKNLYKRQNKRIKEIEDRMEVIAESGKSEVAKRAVIDRLKQQRARIYKAFNRRYDQIKKAA